MNKIIENAILTHSGDYFSFSDPGVNYIQIEDIAHALSMICRFNGHVNKFYSVAEHCVLASWHVEKGYEYDALMHDSAEAFIGDIAKPLKMMLPDFKKIEASVEEHLFQIFNVSIPLPKEVKEIDMILLATEQKLLMNNQDSWFHTHGRKPLDINTIPCWNPGKAKHMFLKRYDELTS